MVAIVDGAVTGLSGSGGVGLRIFPNKLAMLVLPVAARREAYHTGAPRGVGGVKFGYRWRLSALGLQESDGDPGHEGHDHQRQQQRAEIGPDAGHGGVRRDAADRAGGIESDAGRRREEADA